MDTDSDGYENNGSYYSDSDYDNGNEQSSNLPYQFPVSEQQFTDVIDRFVDDAYNDPDVILRKRFQIDQTRKQMDRVFSRQSVLFCIDVEAWEKDPSKVTEIGIAIYDPRFQELALTPNIKTLHLQISENLGLNNGKYVPNNRENFLGMQSWNFNMAAAIDIVQGLIDRYFQEGQDYDCSLVGHDLKNDINWLQNIGLHIPHDARELDTQTLYSYTHGRQGASLKNCLRSVNQPAAYLHNAGNDAYYTILLALKLCDPNVRAVSGFEYNLNNNDKINSTNVDKVILMFS